MRRYVVSVGLSWSVAACSLSHPDARLDAGSRGPVDVNMVDAIDPALVGEIHLAGHAVENHPDGPLLIDDHGSAVTGETWRLFERFVRRSGPRPVLIEWDTDVPEFEVLVEEARKADAILQSWSLESRRRQEWSRELA